MASTPLLRWLARFLGLSLLAVLPAAIVTASSRRDLEQGSLLESEARDRARLFDAIGEAWLRAAADRAAELSALLAQLPEGRPGRAAEGTLRLFLERRLRQDREFDGYLVLDGKGHTLLAVARPGRPIAPGQLEVAQAASRPALVMTASRGAESAGLFAAAPVLGNGRVRALLAARVAGGLLQSLLPASPDGLKVSLVDAGGVALGAALSAPEMSRLGSENKAGLLRLDGRAAAFAPLQSIRAALVVVGPYRQRLLAAGHWVALAVALVCSAVFAFAWSLSRRRPCQGEGLRSLP